jgi:hypothetical protein
MAAPHMTASSTSLFDHPRALTITFLIAAGLFFWQQRDAFGPAAHLLLPDTDDAMRLVQVRDWLAGQSWFDTTQHRYWGGIMHWSRLIDMPIAGLILLLTPLTGQEMAESITVILWPSLIFTAYLALISHQMNRLFGQKTACYALLAAALQPLLTGLAMPGRIDHHNVQYLLITAMVFASVSTEKKAVWGAGILGALSLAIGFETLPFVAVPGLALAIIWIMSGHETDMAKLYGFGLSLLIGAVLLTMFQTGHFPWVETHCDTLAAPGLSLLGGSVIATGVVYALNNKGFFQTWQARGLSIGLAGICIIAACLALFPHCAAGPYAGLPEAVRLQWLPKVLEAMPLIPALQAYPESTLATFGPLFMACLVLVAAARIETGVKRHLLGTSAAIATLGLVIGFTQVRSAYIASAFIPIAGGYGLVWLLKCFEQNKGTGVRAALTSSVILLFSAPWVVPIKGLQMLGAASEPAMARPSATMNAKDLQSLNALPSGRIMSLIDWGPNLLLHTHHSIIAAPYHRNAAGILAALQGLGGNEADLQQVMSENKADYLILPRTIDTLSPQSIGAQIATGLASPSWLKAVAMDTKALKVWKRMP